MMNTAKFFSSGQESSTIFSSTSHTKQLSSINKKVIKVDALLKNSLSLRKKLQEKTVIKKSQLNFQQREKNLEKTKPPETEKGIKSVPTPSGGGIFGWIGNFINNVIFGFIAIRLIDKLPTLLKLVPIINNVMDGIIDWGGKLLEGLVTFIDWGYSAYDNTVKTFAKFGGEGAAKKFEDFMGKFQNVIQYSLIAGMLFSDLALSGGGDQGYDDLVDIDRNKPSPSGQKPRSGRPKVTTGRGGTSPRMRLSGGPKITGTGTKSVLKFVRPFTKRLPIIGALLNFGLSVALGEDPGRAAFKAIGAGLLGAVGAALGGPFALLTGLAGGWLGDKAGGALYDAFFKGDKKKKPSPKRDWFDPRGWFGMRNGGVIKRYASGGSTRGGQYLSDSARREIRPQKKLRRIVTKPAKLYQGRTAGGIDNIQKIFPEPQDIKSPQGTKSQRKDETMNPYGFVSHSYYRMASVPFVGPILAMPLKVMMGDTIDPAYYTSVGQGFSGMMAKAYDEGAFSEDFPIQEFDFEKIVSKSVEQLATREMTSIRSHLMQQLMLEGIKSKPGEQKADDCPCPDPAGEQFTATGNIYERAILDTIAAVEGTSDANGYRKHFAGDLYPAPPWPKSHPDIVKHGGRYSSAAFGRYQFMPDTWRGAASALGLSDMSPANQDKAALYLIRTRHSLDPSKQLSVDQIGKLGTTWAGMTPHYGQTNRTKEQSYNIYTQKLRQLGATPTSTNTQIASSSLAGSVSDCSCDGDGVPDPNGITTPTDPGSVGDGKDKKMYFHWSATEYNANPMGWGYHASFDDKGKKTQIRPYTQRGAHTDKRNTNSIGLTAAAMGGASPSNWGRFPPTNLQIGGMVSEAAEIAKKWGWKSSDITKSNIMTHAEAAREDGYFLGSRDPQERWDFDTIRQGAPSNSGGNDLRSKIKSKMGSAGKFGGGPVNEGLTKVHPGEFIIDKDSVDVFGMEFMSIINQVENKSQLRRAKDSLIQILMEKVPYYSDMSPDEYVTVPSSGGGSGQNFVVLSGSVSGGGSSDSCPWKDQMAFGN